MEKTEQINNLLVQFILQFAPVDKYEGKYNHNEFSFVLFTISKIFRQYTATAITPLQLSSCLCQAGHTLYVQENESGLPKDEWLLSKRKKTKPIDLFDLPYPVFSYVSVSSATMFKLKKATQSIAYFKNPIKIDEILMLKEKLDSFFKENN